MKRYFTVAQRSRRRRGRLVAVPALVAVTTLVVIAATSGRTNMPLFGLTIVAPLVAAVVWGARRGLEARDYIEVDLVARRWVATKNGTRGPEQPLESIAPLQVCLDSADPSLEALADQYFVHPHRRTDLSFLGFSSAAKANAALEDLARRWNVRSERYLGTVRAPAETNVPLHVRLALDANAARELVANPAWGFTVQPLSPGYRFTFTKPSRAAWWYPLLAVGMAVFVLAMTYRYDVIVTALAAEATLSSRLLLGACACVLLACVAHVRYGLFLAWPGTLLITPEGVSIRGSGSHMTFAELEEIACTSGVQFLADGRTMTLPQTWFPADAAPVLAHEITRAILATAPYASRAG
jgi:hypothetical protein